MLVTDRALSIVDQATRLRRAGPSDVWCGLSPEVQALSGVPPIGPNQQMISLAGYRQPPWNTSLVRWTPIPARVLPWRPLPLGFAINTLFYAAILWLFPGSFALRRFLRLRPGLCPKCAYPIGESAVCTECGRPLPSRVRVAYQADGPPTGRAV